MNNQELKKYIDRYKVITFDMFDTLIERKVEFPQHIFRVIDYQLKWKYEMDIDFYKRRIEAEKKARLYENKEVTIDEIYRYFDLEDEENVNLIKKLEIEIELLLIKRKDDIYKIFQYCKELGKDIYVISDMYLGVDILKKILKKNGYCGFKNVYVSCEYRKTKIHKGELFLHFLKQEEIKPSDVLHIGDNYLADYKMPKKIGINAYLINSNLSEVIYNKPSFIKNDIDYKLLNGWLKKRMSNLTGDDFKLGYEVFGPLLYSFTSWLIECCKKKKITKIFFMSRDGYVMKKSFDIFEINEIKGEYFYISRQALMPALYQYDSSAIDMLNRFKHKPKSLVLKDIIKKLGLNEDDERVSFFLNKYKLNTNDAYTMEQIRKDEKNNGFFKEIISLVREESRKSSVLLRDYLKINNFSGDLAIVDLGGAGSIELSLREFCKRNNIKANIYAMYFETSTKFDTEREEYVSFSESVSVRSRLYFMYVLFEVFFSAPHGSVKGYKKVDGNVIADLEIDINSKKNTTSMLNELQNGALEFVENFKRDFYNIYDLNPIVAMEKVWDYGCFPKKIHAHKWGRYNFDFDGFKLLAKGGNWKEILWKSGYLKNKISNEILGDIFIRILMFLVKMKMNIK